MASLARRKHAPARKPVTQSPKYLALKARVGALAKRSRAAAGRNEHTLLVLAGAAAPAAVQRFTGRGLPTVAGIDPGLLWGGALMAFGMYMAGKNGERLKAIGTGVAAPAVARAISTGTIKVSGDEEIIGADDDVGADDDDVGGEEII